MQGKVYQLEPIQSHRGIYSIPEVLARSAREFGKRPALSGWKDGRPYTLTYEEFWERVKQLASALKRPLSGGRCAILSTNSPEWAQAYIAVQLAGGTCVPIDPLLKPFEVKHIVTEAKAKLVFVSERLLETVLELEEESETFKKVIVFGRVPEGLPKKFVSFESLLKKGQKEPKDLEFPGLEDVAAIIYTSGTTGKAKGVVLTHRNIVSDVAACYQVVDFGPEDRMLSVLPMHHTFECTAGFLLPVYGGAHITYARSLKSRELIEDMKRARITFMLGVPLLFQKMFEAIEKKMRRAPLTKRLLLLGMFRVVEAAGRFGRSEEAARILFAKVREKAGLEHLRHFISGGAPLPPHVPKNFRKLGISLVQGYGLTEASPVLTLNPLEAPVDESIGKTLPGVELKVLEASKDGVGELCFRGPMVMKEYYENPKATKEAIDEEGFLRTGDLGYVDEKGYIYICGRAKNVIVTPAGKNVYPEEVEFLLDRSPFILESMVFGVPTERGGEEVAAVIVPDYEEIERAFEGKKLTEEEVRELISKEVRKAVSQLADYKRVKRFVIRDEELPKTSTRKIKRHLVIPALVEALKYS